MAPSGRRSGATGRLLVAVAGVAAFFKAVDVFVTTPVLRNGQNVRGSRLQMRAELGEFSGRCIGNNWTDVQTIPVASEEEAKQAAEAWEIFQNQYEAASKKGIFIDTPVEERDIKYRWRRLMDTFNCDGAKALEIIRNDAVPLVVDSDYVKGTFDALVRGADYEKALSIITRNPAVLTAGKDIEKNVGQAEMAANFVSSFRSVQNLFR